MTIGIYAANEEDPASAALKKDVEAICAKHAEVLGIHGFYTEPGTNRVSFDLLLDFGADSKSVYAEVYNELTASHPEYRFDIVMDSDFSD